MDRTDSPRSSLARVAWLPIIAAVCTISLKATAYFLTGSVGLLSDAIESFVNLASGIMTLVALWVATRPADEEHAYGHTKVEYFASGAEGAFILVAATGIAATALDRLVFPQPIHLYGWGLGIAVLASLINLGVALELRKLGRQYNSIMLEADAQHLLTDVWTSAAVVTGVALVAVTDWERLDPIIALLVAASIVRTGVGIVRRSISGLMDTALCPADREAVRKVLADYEKEGARFHALRTRQAGLRRFVSVHVLVPGDWTVHHGHALLERIEADIRRALPQTTVFTHLESLDDPASYDDQSLEREHGASTPD